MNNSIAAVPTTGETYGADRSSQVAESSLRDLLPPPMDVDTAESTLPLRRLEPDHPEGGRPGTRPLVTALNFLYGCNSVAARGPPSEAQAACLGRRARAGEAWDEEVKAELRLPSWEAILKNRRLNLQGDEARGPERPAWIQIEPGPPLHGPAGSLDPEALAEGLVLELLQDQCCENQAAERMR